MIVSILKLLLSFVSSETEKHDELLRGTPFKEIRVKSELWLIFNGARTIMTIGNTLYVHPDVWKEHHPSYDYSKGVIQVHEALHAQRQFEKGLDSWIWKYVMDKDFRYEEEQLAYKAEWAWMISRGHKYSSSFPIEWAKMISGSTYGNMVGFDKALKWVNETMTELQG